MWRPLRPPSRRPHVHPLSPGFGGRPPSHVRSCAAVRTRRRQRGRRTDTGSLLLPRGQEARWGPCVPCRERPHVHGKRGSTSSGDGGGTVAITGGAPSSTWGWQGVVLGAGLLRDAPAAYTGSNSALNPDRSSGCAFRLCAVCAAFFRCGDALFRGFARVSAPFRGLGVRSTPFAVLASLFLGVSRGLALRVRAQSRARCSVFFSRCESASCISLLARRWFANVISLWAAATALAGRRFFCLGGRRRLHHVTACGGRCAVTWYNRARLGNVLERSVWTP